MIITTTHDKIKQIYPDIYADLLKKKKRSKAKAAARPFEEFTFVYDFSETFESPSAFEIMSGAVSPEVPDRTKTVEVLVAERIARSRVWICASAGRSTFQSTELDHVPQELQEHFKIKAEEEKAEQARFDALSPEEQERELSDTLQKLSKSPGFIAIEIP